MIREWRLPKLSSRFHGETARITLLATILMGSQTMEASKAAEIMPLASESMILGLAQAGARIVAVGERGHILHSSDHGVTWQQVEVPSRASLTAVHFPSPQRGWAVGHDNTILHSSDGGLSWIRQNPPGELENSFLDLYFFNEKRGIVVGAYGLFLRTEDGGLTWSEETAFDEELHFNSIHSAGEGLLYMTLESGFILMSEDYGYTWSEVDSPYEGSLYGLLTTSQGRMITFGLQGNLFLSDDAGESWREIDMPLTNVLTNAIEMRDGTLVISSQGILCISRDSGESFIRWQPPDMRGLSDLIQAEDGSLIVGGLSGLHRFTRLP